MKLFLPIRFDVTIVSIGNNCNVRPDWPESPFGTDVDFIQFGAGRSSHQNYFILTVADVKCLCGGCKMSPFLNP